jgi:hypothetical protein
VTDRGDAPANQFGDNHVGPVLGEFEIPLSGSHVVGITSDLQPCIRIGDENRRDVVELFSGLRSRRRRTRVEHQPVQTEPGDLIHGAGGILDEAEQVYL